MGASARTWLGRSAVALGAVGLGLLAVPASPALARPPLQANDDTATVGRAQGAATGNVLSNDIGPTGAPASPATIGVALRSRPSHGTARVAPDGRFTYNPGACFIGVDTFTYLIVEGKDVSNTAVGTVRVTIPESGSAPLARPDSARVGENGIAEGNLLGNDCGPGPSASAGSVNLSSSPLSGPSKGTVIIDAGSGAFTYRANEGASGVDSFGYQITNRVNPELTSTATVTIRFPAGRPPSTGPGGPGTGGPGTGGGIGGLPPAGPGGTGGSQSGGSQTGNQSAGQSNAGGFAAPTPDEQLSATGVAGVRPTALLGSTLVLVGFALLLMARRRPLEPGQA